MKKRYFILGFLVLFIASIIIGMSIVMKQYEEAIRTLEIGTIDLQNVDDGRYHGEYAIFPIAVEVEVEVSNHEILSFTIIKHDNGQGQPAEAIIEYVIAQQTLAVEIISGATGSSKVISKAIEVALNG